MIMYPCWKRKLCYSLRSKLIDSTLNCREYLKTWVLQYLRMKLAISSSLEPNYTRFYQKFYQNELNHHYPFFGSWNLTMLIWWSDCIIALISEIKWPSSELSICRLDTVRIKRTATNHTQNDPFSLITCVSRAKTLCTLGQATTLQCGTFLHTLPALYQTWTDLPSYGLMGARCSIS